MNRFWFIGGVLILWCNFDRGLNLPLVKVVRDSRMFQGETPGSFSYDIALSDGSRISAKEIGESGQETRDSSAQVVSGEYSFVDDQGNVHTVTYTADKNGFHPHVKFERRGLNQTTPVSGTEPSTTISTSRTTTSVTQVEIRTSSSPNRNVTAKGDEGPLNTISSSLFSAPSNV